MSREDWNYKNIQDFYDRVRLALSAVSSVTLPDEYIDYPEKAPMAEAIIRGRIKDFDNVPDEKFCFVESAIVYQTAFLCQSLVSNKTVKKKQIPTVTLEYNSSMDFTINGMSLSDYVDLLVSQVNGEDDVGSKFVGFRVTKGGKPCWR